jgi:transcriptional regulator with XRE-family HTH domain
MRQEDTPLTRKFKALGGRYFATCGGDRNRIWIGTPYVHNHGRGRPKLARPTIRNRTEVKERLKLLRRKTGLTQAEAADQIGIGLRRFQSWENVETVADLKSYDVLAAFYSEQLGRDITAAHILYNREEREKRLRSAVSEAVADMAVKIETDLLAEIGLG